MPTVITLDWDSRQLDVFRTGKVEMALVRALRRAGGEAARRMKAQASRDIRARKRMKVARVNRALPLIFPRSTRQLDKLVWRMKVSNAPVPLADFPHRQTKKGVMVMVNVGARKLIKGAFKATMKSGHAGVFMRTTKARLPIREAFSTRVSDVFVDKGFIPRLQGRAQSAFGNAFARVLPGELVKAKG